jgi:hypothetical protein
MEGVAPARKFRFKRDEMLALGKGEDVRVAADVVELEGELHLSPRRIALAEAAREVSDKVPLEGKGVALHGSLRTHGRGVIAGRENGKQRQPRLAT